MEEAPDDCLDGINHVSDVHQVNCAVSGCSGLNVSTFSMVVVWVLDVCVLVAAVVLNAVHGNSSAICFLFSSFQ